MLIRMKSKKLIFFFAIIAVLLVILFENTLHVFFKHQKHQILRKIEQINMHEQISLAENLGKLQDEMDAWYTKYHIISHSGGGINGLCYTNSKEAWEHSYNKGNRVIDADLIFTTDSILVLRHEWNDNMETSKISMKESQIWIDRNNSIRFNLNMDYIHDYETFMRSKIHFVYSPQSILDMLLFMNNHPDVYVAADVKRNDIESGYRYLVKAAKQQGLMFVLDRIIVSVYSIEDFKIAKAIYPFKNYSMRQYINNPHSYYDLIKLCVENQIHVVSLSQCYADDEGAKELLRHGIHVFVAVEDDMAVYFNYKEKGFSGVVSNFLYEDDIKTVSLNIKGN